MAYHQSLSVGFYQLRSGFIIFNAMRIAAFISKLFVSILLALLSFGFAVATWHEIGVFLSNINRPIIRLFVDGFLLGLVILPLIYRKISFFTIFEHELTHMLVALMFFKKPRAFLVVEDLGGVVQMTKPGTSDFIIALAPYFLPTLTLLILPIYAIASPKFKVYIGLLLGFSLAYHLLSNMMEFSYRQPDIKQMGYFFSTAMFIFGNIFFTGLILALIDGGFHEILAYLKLGFGKNIDLVIYIKNLIFGKPGT